MKKKSSGKKLGIYRRGDERSGVFWLAWTVAGKRYRESLKTKDEAEATKRALEWKSQPGLLLARQMDREIASYLDSRLAAGKLRPVTASARRCALHAFRRATECEAVHELTTKVILTWYEQRKREVALCTADLHLKMVRAFCRWLVAEGRLRFDPSSSIRPATYFAPARTEFCEAATMDQLIGTAPSDEMRFVLLAGFDAGLRRNEIIQARREWFNLDVGSITIRQTATFKPKNGRPRTVPMTARFLDFMRKLHADKSAESFILAPEKTVSANLQSRIPINAEFNTFTAAQGVPTVHSHTMRRTFASLRVSAGTSIYKVASWLGDRLATTERHYAHLVPVDEEIERIHRPVLS